MEEVWKVATVEGAAVTQENVNEDNRVINKEESIEEM